MRRWLPLMVVLFLLGVGAGFGLDRATYKAPAPTRSLIPSPIDFSPARTVNVPYLDSGIPITQAEAIVKSAGLTPVVRSVDPLGRTPLTYLNQVPAGGTVVLEGTAVTLFAS